MSYGALAALRALREAGVQPPRLLTIAITGACNLRCGHCLVSAGETHSAGHIPARTVRRLLTEFVDLDGEGICITGGEPLCHPAWLQLLQFARALKLERVTIQTNAILFTESEVAALQGLSFPNLTLQVSLDGATARTHDRVRGAGAFAGAMAGLRNLVHSGLGQRITLRFTEMSHNLAEFPALLRLAEGMGITSVVSGTMLRAGRGQRETALTPPDLDQYQRLLHRYATDPTFRRRYEAIGTMAALEWQRESTPRTEFCTFAEQPYLTADGTLYPCVLCHAGPAAVTGVLGKSLAAAFCEGAGLWSALLHESCRRATELQECHDCPRFQVCAGGCMGRAWAAYGDFCSPDDRCALRRAIYTGFAATD